MSVLSTGSNEHGEDQPLSSYWLQTFETFDTNGNGFIDHDELRKLMQVCELNPSQSQVDELMLKFDKNGTGNIGKNEFVALMKYFLEKGLPDPYQQLTESFKFFDAEGTGEIRIDTIMEICSTLGEPMADDESEKFRADLKKCDHDDSDTINMYEFIDLICMRQSKFNKQKTEVIEQEPPAEEEIAVIEPVEDSQQWQQNVEEDEKEEEEELVVVPETENPMSGTPPPPPSAPPSEE